MGCFGYLVVGCFRYWVVGPDIGLWGVSGIGLWCDRYWVVV